MHARVAPAAAAPPLTTPRARPPGLAPAGARHGRRARLARASLHHAGPARGRGRGRQHRRCVPGGGVLGHDGRQPARRRCAPAARARPARLLSGHAVLVDCAAAANQCPARVPGVGRRVSAGCRRGGGRGRAPRCGALARPRRAERAPCADPARPAARRRAGGVGARRHVCGVPRQRAGGPVRPVAVPQAGAAPVRAGAPLLSLLVPPDAPACKPARPYPELACGCLPTPALLSLTPIK